MYVKTNFLLIVSVIISLITQAQKNTFSIGAGPAVGFPFNSNFSLPIGAAVNANYGYGKLGSVIGSITYLNTKFNSSLSSTKISIINTKIGVHSYLNDYTKFFVQADAGVSNYKNKTNSNNVTSFITGLGIGYSFVFKNKNGIDLAPNVNYVSDGVSISNLWLITTATFKVNLKSKR